MSWPGKVWRAVARRDPEIPARRRGGRSALVVIALMLALSGLLRLGNEAGSAFASGSDAIGALKQHLADTIESLKSLLLAL